MLIVIYKFSYITKGNRCGKTDGQNELIAFNILLKDLRIINIYTI